MSMYVTNTSDKKKGTALLLCLLLGWCGAHYFYVGRVGRGIFCWITLGNFLYFGCIIDAIRIGLGSFRDNVGAPLREW